MENKTAQEKEAFCRQIYIRPIRMEDARAIQEIRTSDGVREYILALPSERSSFCTEYIANLENSDHVFVAELQQEGRHKVIGMAGLHMQNGLRERHVATLGIMVNPAYQGLGVGGRLLKALLDLADRDLALVRVELTVFPDNDRAIAMYQAQGFLAEGTKRAAVIRNGSYADLLLMARIHLPQTP